MCMQKNDHLNKIEIDTINLKIIKKSEKYFMYLKKMEKEKLFEKNYNN